ncbi:glycosyltransferase family 62 protein [Atractiella rhizophila]|nr:glycosyltransferase family 62 protein [Atractiella rhizophila]
MSRKRNDDEALESGIATSKRLWIAGSRFYSLLGLGVIGLFVLLNWWTSSSSLEATTNTTVHDFSKIKASPKGKYAQERLLILTPLQDSSHHLPKYFESINRLNYPKPLISLGFLVSDSTDATLQTLKRYQTAFASRTAPEERYASFDIIKKDFGFRLEGEDRHKYEWQPMRRAFLARARNYLLSSCLGKDHSWVLWLDVDVTSYDPDILEDLMSLDKDVVVPNCLLEQNNWEFWGYDRNSWMETPESLALQASLDPSYILVEGYREFPTFRSHMVDLPTHQGLHHIPLDGIGAAFTLVKAKVHREGANFPTYPFQHQIESEGFAKMARMMGFEVVGVPGVIVFHARRDQ